MKITWLGHASIKIETDTQIIYIDPYAGPEESYTKGTIALVTRFTFDHCNMSKLRKINAEHILGTKEVAAQIYPSGIINPGESRLYGEVEIVCVPAKTKTPSIGFVIVADKTVYVMNDSELLPQFIQMRPDVLLIGVGGTYAPTAKQAAKYTEEIQPKLAIPTCWGSIIGTKDDALLYSEITKPVKILEPGKTIEIRNLKN